jgi:hypothetical protein
MVSLYERSITTSSRSGPICSEIRRNPFLFFWLYENWQAAE